MEDSREESAEQKNESGTVVNDLSNKGIGPIQSLNLDDQIDEALAVKDISPKEKISKSRKNKETLV